MYSPRVAYQEGRKIGRSVENLRVNDDELRTLVIKHLKPQIDLRKSDEDRASESLTGFAALSVVLTVLAAALSAAQVFWPDARLVTLLPPGTKTASAFVGGALALLSIALVIAARNASQRASAARDVQYRSILNEGVRGAREVVASRREGAGMSVHRASATTPTHRPAPVFDGQLSPRGAEELAAKWMRSLGATDAQATRYVGDGGIDVESSRFIAQVKHYSMPVGPAAIRELAGVASIDPKRRRPLFFSTAGYQRGAVDFANRTLVALFHMVPETGDLRAQNDIARQLLQHGLD